MLQEWKKINSSTVDKNPWWTYKKDHFEIPGRYRGEYFYVHTNGSAMVIPLSAEGRVSCVAQYRYLCRRISLELPCGSVKEGHSVEETARYECTEEVGFEPQALVRVGAFNPCNGLTDEMCTVFVGTDLVPRRREGDVTEELEVQHLAPRRIDELIATGDIWDGMTIAAWTMAKPAVERMRVG